MNDKEVEQAKEIALTIFEGIDYNKTNVSYFTEVRERQPDIDFFHNSLTADIVHEGGYRFAYFSEIDHLYIGLTEGNQSPRLTKTPKP